MESMERDIRRRIASAPLYDSSGSGNEADREIEESE